jgi:hypothetical protein
MAGVIPVSLPISAEEVKFIQRRQGQLTRNMQLIDQQVRSGQLSRNEGENRKMFLKGEVASLERTKRSRRPPSSVSWQPAPRAPRAPSRATSQSKKYTPSATRGSTTTSRGTSARTTTVPKINTGTAKKVTVRDIPKHIGRSYGSQLSDTDKKSSGGYFYGYNFTSGSRKYTIYYGAVNGSTRAITDFRSWCRIHLGKEYTTYQPYKSPAKKATSVVTSLLKKATGGSTKKTPTVSKTASTPRKSVKENTYGRSYGTSVSAYEKTVYAGGATPIKSGSYYYGPKYATMRKSWEAWNNKYVYGKAPSTSTKTTTSRTTIAKPAPKKTVNQNPYGKSYGTSMSYMEKVATGGKYKKYGSSYYGPKLPTYVTKWKAWNSQYGISGFAGPHHHQHNHRRKQPRRGGPVIDPATRNRAANLRTQSMAKKRVGANIDTSKPVPGGYANGKAMKAPRLQNTEIAGIAGGFSRTRNSMQRLLRR